MTKKLRAIIDHDKVVNRLARSLYLTAQGNCDGVRKAWREKDSYERDPWTRLAKRWMRTKA